MLSAAVLSWFGRSPPPPTLADADAPVPVPRRLDDHPPLAPPPPRTAWPAARLAVTDQLWGTGFTTPGGEIETLRLARPLGLSSASSLLLVGVGGGGAAGSIVRNTGAWVTGLEAETALLNQALAVSKAGQVGKKVSIEAWDPGHPAFARRRYHHCLALEPLRSGDRPEPILDGLARTLKSGGHLVMTELVADTPLSAQNPMVARWAKLEHRTLATMPTASGITRMLGRVGFDVRIVEDISDRHRHNAMIGWRVSIRELAEQRPSPMIAAQLVAEAEMWLLRMRLLRDQGLKMMRWHAIAKVAANAATDDAG